MKPSAALLIDLENFYLSRIDHFNGEGIRLEDRPSFAEDLRTLVRYAQATAKLPFAVRRAYADFDALKVNPQELMRQGVEPVQVFRLSGKTGNKNAADMKLAMDAISLNSGNGPIEHFVLVSGDADFIPVILELKRRGHTVSVIAVTGATNEFIQRFVDHFELFETRQAAEGIKPRERAVAASATTTGVELATVSAALRKLLTNSRPLRLNIVQPRLSRELGYVFDASAFGCGSTGEFLRKYHAALGIVLRGTLNEQELDLPDAPAPSANGSVPAKAAPRPTARPVERTPKPPAPEPHSAAHYRLLLASGRADANEARVLVVPWGALVWVCDAVVPALTPPAGGPATSIELLPRIQSAARATGVPDLDKYAAQLHAAVRCSLPAPSADGVYAVHPGTTGEHIRRRLLRYVVHVLGRRLAESGAAGAIRAESVAEMFHPGAAAADAVLAEVLAALAIEEQGAPAATEKPTPLAIPKPAPRADEMHSAASYRKLLQNGGPKGSGETEHMRVHPVPWPSVERVCADTFELLAPATGGPMTRGLLMAKLYDAEKEMRVEKYDTHVRRAVALLALSNAILEDDSRLKLHPEVADAGDIRWAALGMMLRLLAVRLEEKGVAEPIRAEEFVAAVEAGPLTAQMVPEIARAIAGMYYQTEPVEPRADDTFARAAADDEVQLDAVADEPEPVTSVVEVEPVVEETAGHERAGPGYRPEPVTPVEPADWDPFAFDAVLPDEPSSTLVIPPRVVAPDDIDVSALTSAAVVEPPVPSIPALVKPKPKAPPDDDLRIGVHVGDWVSDDEDVLFTDPEGGVERITERLTGSSTRLRAAAPLSTVKPIDNDDEDALFTDPDGGIERITERLTGSSVRLAPRLTPTDSSSRLARIIPKPRPPAPSPPPFPPESK